MKREKNNYFDNSRVYDVLVKYRKSGDSRMPDELGDAVLTLVQHILQSSRYAGFSESDRQEFASAAMIKVVKAIEAFDYNKSRNIFGYLTRTVQNSIYTSMYKWYRNRELIEELKTRQLTADGKTDRQISIFKGEII